MPQTAPRLLTVDELRTKMPGFKRSFVEWSQSEYGFYINKYWDESHVSPDRHQWEVSAVPRPIRWRPHEVEVMSYLFTVNDRGRLPHAYVYWIDIGKSAKSLKHAAIAQWFNMFHGYRAENVLAANSKKHAEVRCWEAMVKSIEANPWKTLFIEKMLTEEIVFRHTQNKAWPVPLKAATVSGGDFGFVGIDELWGYEGKSARDQIAELKLSPTQSINLFLATSYPPFLGSDGPLNDTLDTFFDERDSPLPNTEHVPGLEHLPLYVRGDYAIWWNHEPRHPWHTPEFMQSQRDNPSNTKTQFERIWRASRVHREDTFMPLAAWADCESDDLIPAFPLNPHNTGRAMALAIDLGVSQDSSAVIGRAWNPTLQRYDLMIHRIFNPDHYQHKGEIIEAVLQFVLLLDEYHELLVVGYDPRHAVYMAEKLRKAGIKTMEFTQNNMRVASDTQYQSLIQGRTLRNYDAPALTEQVAAAVAINRGDGDIRIMKSKTNRMIDAVVADSMACYLCTQYIAEFERWHKRMRNPVRRVLQPPRTQVWRQIYGR